jgi:hypothetical protein
MERVDYHAVRGRYEPASVTLVIVAESPPASGLYFYDPAGRTTEPLFAALIKQLGVAPASKVEGLREFQERGWVLVVATYQPANEIPASARNAVIKQDHGLLRAGLTALLTNRAAPLLLMKANVCELLEPRSSPMDSPCSIAADVSPSRSCIAHQWRPTVFRRGQGVAPPADRRSSRRPLGRPQGDRRRRRLGWWSVRRPRSPVVRLKSPGGRPAPMNDPSREGNAAKPTVAQHYFFGGLPLVPTRRIVALGRASVEE